MNEKEERNPYKFNVKSVGDKVYVSISNICGERMGMIITKREWDKIVEDLKETKDNE